MEYEDAEPLEMPIDGTLDLHTFRPRETADLVEEYIRVCRERQILTIRIIHGKGIGTLREIVHAHLKKNPLVADFHLAGERSGGWGATIVYLKPLSSN